MDLRSAAPNLPHGIVCRLVSENGLIEMGLYRVAYGWRVRAGFTQSGGCDLDWCGGAYWPDIRLLYSAAAKIISLRAESTYAFVGLPGHSEIKPYHKDAAFCSRLRVAADVSYLGDLPLWPLDQSEAYAQHQRVIENFASLFDSTPGSNPADEPL